MNNNIIVSAIAIILNIMLYSSFFIVDILYLHIWFYIKFFAYFYLFYSLPKLILIQLTALLLKLCNLRMSLAYFFFILFELYKLWCDNKSYQIQSVTLFHSGPQHPTTTSLIIFV